MTTATIVMHAVLVDSEETAYQYFVFPTGGEKAIVFSRPERQGQWSLDHKVPEGILPDRQPTAVVVTSDDVEQWRETGLPTEALSRAMRLHRTAPSSDSEELSADLIDRVRRGDPTLSAWDREEQRPGALDITERPAIVPVYAPSDSMRMAYLPDISIAQRYVHRNLFGVRDFDVFRWARANRKNVLLYGPTGPGKTMSAEALAAEDGMPLAMVSGNVAMTTHQILGGLVNDGHGNWVWQDGIATDVVRNGGLLDLDELNFIPAKIATVLFPLLAGQRHITLLDNKGETVKAHPDLFIMATMNPSYAGTMDLNAALRNRFAIQINWGYDEDVERQLIPAKALRDLARKLRDAELHEEIMTPTPTNALMDFAEIAQGLGIDFAIGNFVGRYAEDEQSKVKVTVEAMKDNFIEDIFGDPSEARASSDLDEDDPGAMDEDALRSLANLNLN